MSDFNKSIIYLVQANPVLYNSSLANYKNGRVKEKIWNQISEGLQVEVDACKKRWRSLRNKYCKELKVSKNGQKTGCSSIIPKKWKYLELMTFLEPHIQPKESTSNVPGVVIELEHGSDSLTQSERTSSTARLTLSSKSDLAFERSPSQSTVQDAGLKKPTLSRKRKRSTEYELREKTVQHSHEALEVVKLREKADGPSIFAEVVADKLRTIGDTLDIELQILQLLNTAIKEKNEQQSKKCFHEHLQIQNGSSN